MATYFFDPELGESRRSRFGRRLTGFLSQAREQRFGSFAKLGAGAGAEPSGQSGAGDELDITPVIGAAEAQGVEAAGAEASASTPDASPARNEILEEHARQYPEGDPTVRRKDPEKGTAGGRPVKMRGKKDARTRDLGSTRPTKEQIDKREVPELPETTHEN